MRWHYNIMCNRQYNKILVSEITNNAKTTNHIPMGHIRWKRFWYFQNSNSELKREDESRWKRTDFYTRTRTLFASRSAVFVLIVVVVVVFILYSFWNILVSEQSYFSCCFRNVGCLECSNSYDDIENGVFWCFRRFNDDCWESAPSSRDWYCSSCVICPNVN